MLPGEAPDGAKTATKKTGRKAFGFLTFGLIFPFACLYAIQNSLEDEKRRRHMSIARDIEREKWRRQQLGLPPAEDDDDGFVKKFEKDGRNAHDIDEARKSIGETVRIMKGGVPIPEQLSIMDKFTNWISRRPV